MPTWAKDGAQVGMPTHRELLDSLRQQYEELPLLDWDELAKVRERGLMLVSLIFGEDSRYFKQLSEVSFQYRGPMMTVIGVAETSEEKRAKKERSERNWLKGQERSLAIVDSMREQLELEGAMQTRPEPTPTSPESRRVFVVHGRDYAMRESVARVLSKLNLDPIILHEQEDRGRTIIEKLHAYSDVGFAVVLLSPDDTGYSNAEGSESAKPRARQNVMFELGFFIGRLGRENVVALHRGGVEIPTDYAGVLFQPYESDGVWPYKLAKELRGSGYDVSSDVL
jgi:predicted nucleotide-binding protein